MLAFRRITSVVALLAIAVWLGGLIALGAIAAPVVFSIVAAPSSADAMTVVFRRFDAVAMACAAVVLATEAIRVTVRPRPTGVDRARGAVSVVAATLAVWEGTSVSPQIASLHAGGAIRGLGASGLELARLHDIAEACGKATVVALAILIVLHVLSASGLGGQPARPQDAARAG